mmetsp:Transcript_3311/g.5805  ORF Transcript_3311/g.5805 Transcript_3311/m.5805 type:complete len:312 (-) Transcript_3311:48-983(-)|eukprot:CAMPEP_0197450092 /NCGR_PEP_ID=MMETSP1175-20131217/23992_1 /TAXON_ID=1003142 /ORGANISM="Triceratium dubium, Strain CCMP147" /LENGTH=311 /DNA_ID=CAMNT_0042982435 /DNA_START=60 /DNA_END=995 /DNA_ORIENTATION=-
MVGYTFVKQTVAVIGATGQVGSPLSKTLLDLGHTVKVLTRKPLVHDKAEHLEGADVVVLPDMHDKAALVKTLKDVDVLVCAVPGSEPVINKSEPIWLDAAVEAGVKRFVPTEFGLHTRNADYGDGVIFDWKKKLHEKIFATGIGWTFFYNGGIFDYFLPNLRFFEKITTFGDCDLPLQTHEIRDIGRCAAMAVTDARTLNKCVQMDFNMLTQNQMLALLKQNFPDHTFEYTYYSKDYIVNAMETAGEEVTAKKGAETDKERWGINYAVFVKGILGAFTEETMRTTELYPKFVCEFTPEAALASKEFVFGNK